MAETNNLQQMMPSSASFSPQEMLSFLSASGTIDLSGVRNEMISAYMVYASTILPSRFSTIWKNHIFRIYVIVDALFFRLKMRYFPNKLYYIPPDGIGRFSRLVCQQLLILNMFDDIIIAIRSCD